MRARSRLEELRAAPEEPPLPPPDPARAVRSPSSARPKTVSEGCCVECSQPSPYVFPPLAVRLCESCERLPSYALVTADLARHAYALRDDEFPRGWRATGGDQVYLRSECEAAASGVAARKRAASAKQWRAETFKKVGGNNNPDGRSLNTATFQKQRANGKHLGLRSDARRRRCGGCTFLACRCDAAMQFDELLSLNAAAGEVDAANSASCDRRKSFSASTGQVREESADDCEAAASRRRRIVGAGAA